MIDEESLSVDAKHRKYQTVIY